MNRDERADLLRTIASNYVANLAAGDFDRIPYVDEVELRAPLCPGGSDRPLVGKQNLKEQWWSPLPELVSETRVIDIFINQDLTGVAVEFHCRIDSAACTLRVIDRFQVNEVGQIVSQENFFDPRDVTNPGWASAPQR